MTADSIFSLGLLPAYKAAFLSLMEELLWYPPLPLGLGAASPRALRGWREVVGGTGSARGALPARGGLCHTGCWPHLPASAWKQRGLSALHMWSLAAVVRAGWECCLPSARLYLQRLDALGHAGFRKRW